MIQMTYYFQRDWEVHIQWALYHTATGEDLWRAIKRRKLKIQLHFLWYKIAIAIKKNCHMLKYQGSVKPLKCDHRVEMLYGLATKCHIVILDWNQCVVVAWLAFTDSRHVHLCRTKERRRNRDGIERERIWRGWRVRGRDVTCPLLNASHSKQWLPPPNGHESQSWYERLRPTASEPNHTRYTSSFHHYHHRRTN